MKSDKLMKNKIAIIGAGFVGSTCAYALFMEGVASEIALVDVNKEKAKGEALDLVHGNLYTSYTRITYGDSYELCADADIIVITAGANQKPGESRLDLTQKNADILRSIISQIIRVNDEAIILMVTNPLDVLTYLALKWSGFPEHRVFGTGTSLDTARFKQSLSDYYGVNPSSIHAYILGEHGDSEFPVWSSANVAGIPLSQFKKYDKAQLDTIFTRTKNAAYEIINTKGSTYYAIGLVVTSIIKDILTDQRKIHPISCHINDYYGVSDVCLSIPVVLSRTGIMERLPLPLDENEIGQLKRSASLIKEAIKKVQTV
jgi:L-lactate dehydrogenase